jgi:predicted nucleotidyltransferase
MFRDVWSMNMILAKTFQTISDKKEPIDVVISLTPGMTYANRKEMDDSLTDLFTGLSDAISKHGCQVDLSDPANIKVTKK